MSEATAVTAHRALVHSAFRAIADGIRAKPDDVQLAAEQVKNVESALRDRGGYDVAIFGSRAYGFALAAADVDMVVTPRVLAHARVLAA